MPPLHELSPFIIPPALSLIIGVGLAAIALFRGRYTGETVLLAVVIIWWTLLSPAFLSHHLVQDEQVILDIERSVHFLYVFLPAVNILFIERINGRRSFRLIGGMFTLSFLLSLTTFTDYYFSGLQRFSWGYIARGGPAFQVFAFYSAATVTYMITMVMRRLAVEKNPLVRLKLRYINFSLLAIAGLTLLNVPAVLGFDFYPLGNFMFLPLGILTYGILRHRLIDFESIFFITVPRILLSSLILLPNIAIFIAIRPHFTSLPAVPLFAILMIWFLGNHLYLRTIQPLIDRIFQERQMDLKRERRDRKQRKYGTSHLKELDLDGIGERLRVLMGEEKLYCDEDLDLRRLAEMLDLTTHQLSEYLNTRLGRGFYAYINEFRIEDAKRQLLESDRSVLSIALAVGFNSRSVFNRAFLKQVGKSPNQFRKETAVSP